MVPIAATALQGSFLGLRGKNTLAFAGQRQRERDRERERERERESRVIQLNVL